MQILLWLVPAAVATCLAMAVAAWAGRERTVSDRREEAAQERFARAILKEHPGAQRVRPRPARDRSTGIAVRRPAGQAGQTSVEQPRRSA